MNKELFNELEILMNKKREYEGNLKALNTKPYCNLIELSKGLYKFYFESDLIPVLINYYEGKIKSIDEKISKFKLSKIID